MHEDRTIALATAVAAMQKEIRTLKRQLRDVESQLQRNKTMLAAYTSINEMLTLEQRRMQHGMNLLLENSPDIILLFDAEGRLLHCTNTFLAAADIAEVASINGAHLRDIFSRFASLYWVADLEASFEEVMRSRQHTTLYDIVDMDNSGSPRDYIINIAPMLNDADTAVGALMLFHDQTDMVLAKVAAEKAKEVAERAGKAKSRFMEAISHEMSTPMKSILGMSKIAKSSSEASKKDRCIDKIEIASRYLLGVISDIMSMSKIETSTFSLTSETVSMEKTLASALGLLSSLIEEKQLAVNMVIADDAPVSFTSDRQHLIQVLGNLIDNAVKFTPEGGSVNVNVGRRIRSDGLIMIRMEVSDSGPGIAKNHQETLFQPFEQIYANRHRHKESPGLGLAVSKSIVGLMGGRIWVESEEGHGATFIIELPVGSSVGTDESLSDRKTRRAPRSS
jgi:signal transduction histidine kinase